MKKLIIFSSLLLALFGCKSTKNIETSTDLHADTAKSDSSGYYKKIIDSTGHLLQIERATKNNRVVFNTPTQPTIVRVPPDTLWRDVECPTCPKNELSVGTDGTITASGNILSFDLQEEVWKSKEQEWAAKLEQEHNTVLQKESEVVQLREQLSKHKETKFMTFWWLYLLCFVAGAVTTVFIAWKRKQAKALIKPFDLITKN